MARRRENSRVLGPYPHRRQWRLVVVGEDGTRDVRCFTTEAEAKAAARELTRLFGNAANTPTVGTALDGYEAYLQRKGNKERSIKTTLARLVSFFPDSEVSMRAMSSTHCKRLYDALQERTAVDTHRNTLAEVKTFLGWCVRQRYLTQNPAKDLVGEGKRKRGKEQLRIDEARLWTARAIELAQAGQPGAVAALVTLLMGLRAEEIVSRQVRDLDDGGRLLWIPESKTDAGRRRVEVPVLLQPLLSDLAAGRKPTDRLFGRHWRDWPRKWVQRICRDVGVPKVNAHGMRGLHATLAEDSGITAHAVAGALGHESPTTTHAHYTAQGAVARVQQRRAIGVLLGDQQSASSG